MDYCSNFKLSIISNNYDRVVGILGWKVTVISSNFIALMLILNNGNEYTYEYKISTIKKNNPNLKKAN